ncbi:cysteine and histidine-rich protein 1 isoform X3 [Tachyglossus aculeatus]|uniref:cysteine and histidine-rich protein 1 isoform X3 n=1 Tax=Tachyglossus aculeatus TaxID=9261 RepID=UPI0018F4FA30|nr:cysteine and histidine-rich protein 1 isoform X3 [Tachyglossus aculeatus]
MADKLVEWSPMLSNLLLCAVSLSSAVQTAPVNRGVAAGFLLQALAAGLVAASPLSPGLWPDADPRAGAWVATVVGFPLLAFGFHWCTNGHLMCAGCFIHLLADARLKEEQATCPNCRCEISKSLCCRNLAVEKAVSELPSECGFCLQQFPRSLLERHQKEECQDRVTQCKYKRIGCPWQGPFHELTAHEADCTHPSKTGNELMEILDGMDQTHKKEMQLYNSIFNLLSFEKIGYTEVQFRPYRTDDFITRLYYETPRFTVLNQTWVLKARVNDSERNPNLSCKRTLSFQLILKSKTNSPMECSFLLLKGPYDDVKINPVIYHFVFTNENNETEYVPLPIIDSVECNKLLAAKNINLRLFIFQIQK